MPSSIFPGRKCFIFFFVVSSLILSTRHLREVIHYFTKTVKRKTEFRDYCQRLMACGQLSDLNRRTFFFFKPEPIFYFRHFIINSWRQASNLFSHLSILCLQVLPYLYMRTAPSRNYWFFKFFKVLLRPLHQLWRQSEWTHTFIVFSRICAVTYGIVLYCFTSSKTK